MGELLNLLIIEYFSNLHNYSDLNELKQHVCDAVEGQFNRQISTRYVTRIINQFRNGKLVVKMKMMRRSNHETRVAKIKAEIEKDPNASVRKISDATRIPTTTVHAILKEEKLKPYKEADVQTLSHHQMNDRVTFCQIMKERDIDFNYIWFSDEKRFELNHRGNHQNTRMWARERPANFVNSRDAHPINVHVWCALSSQGIIGPYFFENNVDQFEYQKMIDLFFYPKLRDEFELSDRVWFQQDGATCHTTDASLEL